MPDENVLLTPVDKCLLAPCTLFQQPSGTALSGCQCSTIPILCAFAVHRHIPYDGSYVKKCASRIGIVAQIRESLYTARTLRPE